MVELSSIVNKLSKEMSLTISESLPANENQEINPIFLQQKLKIARNEINNLR